MDPTRNGTHAEWDRVPDTEAEDTTLALAAARGDHEAFAALVRRYENVVFHAAYLVTGTRADADDLSQEIYLKLWRGLPGYRREAKFLTWLTSLIKHASTDWIRRKKRTPDTTSLTHRGEDDTPSPPEPADTAPESSPEDMYERHRMEAAVRRAMATLSDEHRLVVQLRDIEGMSYEDMAERLGIPPGTIRSRLARARSQIKKILERENFF